ncbi:MAG: NAD(P)H-binding protein, partial [Burkholderiales bacterium]|nr:NAD(P)H-binding protein [Burkholderiales bacterium]
MKLVVFGASGATGRHLGSLAAAAGWSVRAFLRSEEARGRVGGAKETVVGDPTDPAVVAAAIRGADAVAVCLGNSRRTHPGARNDGRFLKARTALLRHDVDIDFPVGALHARPSCPSRDRRLRR